MGAADRRAAGTCVLCGRATALLYDDCTDFEYFMTAPGDLYRCSGCGLVAMEPMPTRAELPGLYPAEYENFSGPGNPIARFLLALERVRPAVGREAGAHAAVFLHVHEERGDGSLETSAADPPYCKCVAVRLFRAMGTASEAA